jgi:lysophospholipase L1-like esterase
MNTNPHAISVLCYGDSNTYGQKPDRSGRFDASNRWPGIAQDILGNDYYIIEEGLGGRTTDLEHTNPNKAGRNGLTYFKTCLESHSPVDVIVIMLGTNDFKVPYDRTAEDIAVAIQKYVDYTNSLYTNGTKKPKILLVSTPYMDDTATEFYSSMPTPGIYDHSSVTKSHDLAPYIEKLAVNNNLTFLDAAPYTQTGQDGIHITEQSHQALGEAIAQAIKVL